MSSFSAWRETRDDPSLARPLARPPSSGEIRVCMQLHNGGRNDGDDDGHGRRGRKSDDSAVNDD